MTDQDREFQALIEAQKAKAKPEVDSDSDSEVRRFRIYRLVGIWTCL